MFPQTLAQELGFMVTAILHLLQKKHPKIDLKLFTYNLKVWQMCAELRFPRNTALCS